MTHRRALLEDCMRVLFYRDCRALNRIQIAKATVEGTVVSDAYTVSDQVLRRRIVEVRACYGGGHFVADSHCYILAGSSRALGFVLISA